MLTASPADLVLLCVAGLVSGAINAVAGGGSLLLFPALLAAGLPPLPANVTNSVAQSPGYLGLAVGARRQLRGQRRRIALAGGVAMAGSLAGTALLLGLPTAAFNTVIPILVAAASLLLGLQTPLKRWVGAPEPAGPDRRVLLACTVFVAAIYGGYFGGALGVILIAVLSLAAGDDLRRLNAAKGVLSLLVSLVTVVVFAVAAPVHWLAVALLAPTTLIGGYAGGLVAGRVPVRVLRLVVVVIGLAAAAYLAFWA